MHQAEVIKNRSDKINHRPSIVIPTYNRAHLLPRAIESCFSQTISCEIIIVDHGSTDNTKEVVASYGEKLTYISREKDNGPHFCWLDGIINASSEYIHLLYDDDWIHPTFMEKTINLMDDSIGCVITGAQMVDINTGKKGQFRSLKPTGIYDIKTFERHVIKNTVISPSCVLFRKQMMLDAMFMGRLPRQIYEYKGVGLDIYFMLVSFLNYRNVGYINEALAFFGRHKQSITMDSFSSPEKQSQLIRAYDEVKSYYLLQKYINFPMIRNFIFQLYRGDFSKPSNITKKIKTLLHKLFIKSRRI